MAGILKARPNTGVVWVDAHADINTPGVVPLSCKIEATYKV